MLKPKPNIPWDEAHVQNAEHPYIAVKTAPGYTPAMPWTLFKAVTDSQVPKNTVHVGTTQAFSEIPVIQKYIEPKSVSHIVLTAPAPEYARLEKRQNLLSHIPSLVRQGLFLEELQCRIKACEPVDQGIVSDNVCISVVCEPNATSDEANDDVDIESFLEVEKKSLSAPVKILTQPVSPQSMNPRPEPYDDLENVVFMRVDQVAKLGTFSGDWITLKSDTKTRVVKIYAYPEPNTLGEDIYLPPLLAYNMGTPSNLEISTDGKPPQPIKDVTISRVASAISTDRTYQQAFLSGLRAYFEQAYRVVKNNDIIAVPIDTLLAQTLFSPGSSEEQAESLTGTPDAIVWFKISVDEEEGEWVVNPAHTRMVQSGLVQEKYPPSSLEWQRYYGLEPTPRYLSFGTDNFKYAWKTHQLLRASLTPQGATLHATLLMTSSKRGAGKFTVLNSIAAELGIHVMELDCFQMIGDSDAKTVGTLKARLDRACQIAPCLVVLRHLDAIAKKSQQDGRDPNIISSLNETMTQYLQSNLIIAATTSDPDKLSDTIRNLFKFEIDVTVPTESERKCIFKIITADIADTQLWPVKDLEGFQLQGNISHDSLALQSAGLTPPDLQSIIRVARQQANARLNNDSDFVVCQRGIAKITNEDFECAISDARAKYSDSIGAPKIPNVGWKDVGGLDNVKGEIMDTIEMPLKYPQLFASGIKKRSGILFYGPPGTGKTLMAKAIATSFSLNFFSVKGPELLNMYIGESEANVRRVFQKARDAKPCVVFFDELDSVAPKRGNQGDSGGVMDRIVSQLLAELDGMSEGGDGVFVIGATNRPDLLDEALLRPGRFDKMLYLGVSDTHEKQRTILQALTRKFDLSSQVDLAKIAEKCPFTFTGADFYAMSSDAMLNAMTRTAGEVDEKIAAYNKEREENGEPPISIRSWFQNVATEEDTHVQVTEQDFDKARNDLVPSVSADELAHYRRVREMFEGKSQAQPQQNHQNGQVNGKA